MLRVSKVSTVCSLVLASGCSADATTADGGIGGIGADQVAGVAGVGTGDAGGQGGTYDGAQNGGALSTSGSASSETSTGGRGATSASAGSGIDGGGVADIGRGGSSSTGGSSGGVPSTGGSSTGSGGVPSAGGGGASSTGGSSAGSGGESSMGGSSAGSGGSSDAAGGTGSNNEGCKRGVAYGHHSEADLSALAVGVSWWYNWYFSPDDALPNGAYQRLGVEFVPMIWGEQTDRAAAQSAISGDAKVLLGFNEPNFGEQANLSALQAAALWPELELIATTHRLALASPAVNYCGGNCQDTDPFNYLHEFFSACVGCRIDYVAMHIYVGCNPSAANRATWLIDHVERYKSEFDLPLWLTEFACSDARNEGEQIAFLEDAVVYLEAEPRIARYAWFAGRADNMAYVDLLGSDGQLTALGSRYVTLPQSAACQR